MKLKAWIDTQMTAAKDAGISTTRKQVVRDLATKAGIAYGTLAPVERNACLVMYDKALAVSQATGWLVTVIELCDPEPDTRLAQIRGSA